MGGGEHAGAAEEDSLFAGYAPPKDRPPFGPYAAMATLFAGGMGGFLYGARRGSYDLPEEISTKDLVLLGVASHKLSRLIAKDKVTSFVRAPFRRYEGQGGPGELSEETRGEGLRAAFGEFIGCPYCLALWVSGGLSIGMVLAPKETRFVSGVLSAFAISDFLQLAYAAGQEKLTN